MQTFGDKTRHAVVMRCTDASDSARLEAERVTPERATKCPARKTNMTGPRAVFLYKTPVSTHPGVPALFQMDSQCTRLYHEEVCSLDLNAASKHVINPGWDSLVVIVNGTWLHTELVSRFVLRNPKEETRVLRVKSAILLYSELVGWIVDTITLRDPPELTFTRFNTGAERLQTILLGATNAHVKLVRR